MAIAIEASNPQWIARVKANDLAEALGISRRQVGRNFVAIDKLGEALEIEPGGGRGKAAAWQVIDLADLYGFTRRPWIGRPQRDGQMPLVAPVRDLANVDTQTSTFGGNVDTNVDRNVDTHARAGSRGERVKQTPLTPAERGSGFPGRGLRALGTNPRAVAARAAASAAIASLGLPGPDHAAAGRRVIEQLHAAVDEASAALWLDDVAVAGVDVDGGLVLLSPAKKHSHVTRRWASVLAAVSAHLGVTARFATPEEAAALHLRLAS